MALSAADSDRYCESHHRKEAAGAGPMKTIPSQEMSHFWHIIIAAVSWTKFRLFLLLLRILCGSLSVFLETWLLNIVDESVWGGEGVSFQLYHE